jgi:hypothetical protein
MSAAPPPPPPPASPTAAGGYPATLTFDPPEKIARWRIIGNIILAIPQFIVVYVLGIVAEILALVAWIVGLITGKIPEGLLGFIAMYIRYSARVSIFMTFLKEEYPPFSFETSFTDPGDDPRIKIDFTPNLGKRNRLTIFFRLLLAIPQFIVLVILAIGWEIVVIIAWFAVLFIGHWPEGLRNYAIGYQRWSLRLSSYVFLLTDEYPPFSMS